MCDIMNGDASSVLMNLVELCGWGNSLTDFCSLFGLISVSHLTYLLAKSGVAAATLTGGRNQDILGELLGVGRQAGALSATFPNEAPFVEELFLESVQRLNELQFPLEVRHSLFFIIFITLLFSLHCYFITLLFYHTVIL